MPIYAPRQYKASTLVLVSPQKIPEAFVQATVTSKVEERLQSIAQEVLSRTRLEQIIGELKLYQKEQKDPLPGRGRRAHAEGHQDRASHEKG